MTKKVSQTGRRRQAARTGKSKQDDVLLQAVRQIALAEQAQFDARSKLTAIFEDSTNPTELADASNGLLAIERDLGVLKARRLALRSSPVTLLPPSDADIAEAQRIAAELAKPIAASARAAAIAGLAADIVVLTGKLGV